MTLKGRKQINMVRKGVGIFPTAFGRFENSYMPEPNTGCWIWIQCVNKGGYGQICIRGKAVLANRFSYLLFKGDPSGKCVLHHCDNSYCVNPDHLYLGDRLQNIKDRDSRGRVQRGAKHVRAKFTDLQINVIREATKEGYSNASIGRYFKVGGNTISNIKTRDTWKHI